MLLTSVGKAFSQPCYNKNQITVQFQCRSAHNPVFSYCDKVVNLYNDWMDEAKNCPENDAMLLSATFYYKEASFPVVQIGLSNKITFETLMKQIKLFIEGD